MTITPATQNRSGVRFFYVRSDSGKDYTVTHIRRAGMNRWSCSCPDFFFRGQTKGSRRFCKHLRAVQEFNEKEEQNNGTN